MSIPAAITRWRTLNDTQGQRVDTNWKALFDEFYEWQAFAGDFKHPGWSAAQFKDDRRLKVNALLVSAMVLDYDGTTPLLDAADQWERFYGFLHTTRSNGTEEHESFRIILPFGRNITPAEYEIVWQRVAEETGFAIDKVAKDPSRFWYTPGCADPDKFYTCDLNGQPLDPDQYLKPRPSKPKAQVQRSEPLPRHIDHNHVVHRASRYLASMPEAISGSGGHDALWRATLALVKGFELSDSDALHLLRTEYNHRCQPEWPDKDLVHKVKQANGATVPTGYLLNEDNYNSCHHVFLSQPTCQHSSTAVESRETARETPAIGGYDSTETAVQRYGVKTQSDLLKMTYERVKEGERQRGCPSGHGFIDDLIGGFRPQHVTVLGATTNWGKSSFTVMASDASIEAGFSVLTVSGEDGAQLYGQRFAAKHANINALNLRDGRVTPSELTALAGLPDRLSKEPFFLDGVGKSAEFLARAIRDLCAERHFDLVIVDYLQAFRTEKRCQDRRNEVTHVAREFTDAIKMSGASGLLLSQVKRLEKPGARPTMYDLKESGDIENMAEHILIGWSSEPEQNEYGDYEMDRFVSVEKNKDGPKMPDPIRILFNFSTAAFVPMTREQYIARGFHEKRSAA